MSSTASRAIAVAAAKRSPAFPNLPTATEAGLPGYEVSTWYAMWVPKGTPKAVDERVYAELLKAMNTAELKDRKSTRLNSSHRT